MTETGPQRVFSKRADRRPGFAGLIAAAGFLYLVLAIPNHPAALAPDILLVFPLELPVILLALLVVPKGGWWMRGLRAAITVLLTLMTLIKAADFATFSTYNRGFNPLVDLHLIPAAWNLGSGAVGEVLAAALVAAALLTLAGLACGIWWATGRWAAISVEGWRWAVATLALVPTTALAVAEIGDAMRRWSLPFDLRAAAFTTRVALERADMLGETSERLRAFRTAAADDPFAAATPLMDRLAGRDVLLTYIESYGASSLTNPRYAPTHLQTLEQIEQDLASRGLAMRSGWLTAPMIGGQSWLSHATLATGLWSPDQRTYGAALVSGRQSLFHLAQQNGFETVAVMPAITLDWPEVEFMGFDRVFAAADLGYAGLPFNWVTMPDQFTLSAFEDLVYKTRRPEQIFVQIALISSHAPWTPVPTLVPWDDIGDGRIFDDVAQSGDPPEVVWRDRDRVRDQFRQAVDYSLRSIGSFMARHAEAPPLFIVLGDHQPALFVSEDEGFDVPIHIIGPPDLVARFGDWGWQEGLIPASDVPVLRMDAFRNRFLETFSSVSP